MFNKNEIFENLFVLELVNNHWGKLVRNMQIINEFATLVFYNYVKTSIKSH